MKAFDRILDVQQRSPGIWHVRFAHKDGPEEGSEFIKIRSEKIPDHAQIMAEVTKTIGLLNNPPALPSIIPENPPDIAGLTPAQRTTFRAVWNLIKVWLRDLLRG